MAERCGHCGSADISVMGGAFSCLDCNQQTEYGGLAEQRVVADDATYAVDPAQPPQPKASKKAK